LRLGENFDQWRGHDQAAPLIFAEQLPVDREAGCLFLKLAATQPFRRAIRSVLRRALIPWFGLAAASNACNGTALYEGSALTTSYWGGRLC
jgi:hypothetical protein